MTIAQLAVIFQLATPLIIGGLIGLQFGFNPMQMMVVAGAHLSALVLSALCQILVKQGVYVGSGTGDIINTMITANLLLV